MRKLLITFCILLLSYAVYSADFADSFATYRSQIKNNLNVSTSNTNFMSDSTMNQMIRQAVIQVNSLIKPIKNRTTITTTYNNSTYSLDSTVIGVIDVYWKKGDSVKSFLYQPKKLWYQNEILSVFGRKGYDGRPSFYDYIDDELYLFPTPWIAGDTIVVVAWQKVQNIADSTTDLSNIPQQYRIPIVMYATYLVAVSKQNPMVEIYYKNYLESIQAINGVLNDRGEAISNNPKP